MGSNPTPRTKVSGFTEETSPLSRLTQLKDKPDFEPIAVSFKRVVNIIRRAEGFSPGKVEEHLLAHPSESGLLSAYRSVYGQVQEDLSGGRYTEALARVATLRPPVDAFFDDVMVVVEDPAVRQNRLSLLALVAGLFDTFADFSKLSASIEGGGWSSEFRFLEHSFLRIPTSEFKGG